MTHRDYDAIVVGSGPNGLTAALTLATEGRHVLVVEGADTYGGGLRSEELTLPGFLHDVCSSVHPLALASPAFRDLDLSASALKWIQPPIAAAHPFADGSAAFVAQDVRHTMLGYDTDAYAQLVTPFVEHADELVDAVLGRPLRWPPHPLLMARFMRHGLPSATRLADSTFDGEAAKGLLAGMAAHSVLPMDRPFTGAFALLFTVTAHAWGWPFAAGGSRRIADALVSRLRAAGCDIETGWRVRRLEDLPPADAYVFDTSPRDLAAICGDRLPATYRGRLQRFRYGPGVFKVDYALDAPIPWTSEECRRAGTVHVGGRIEDIARAELEVAQGRHPERPFLLVAQPSLFDVTRAPAGKHTAWMYCHVPSGSTVDMLPVMEAQLERFAPGFRERVLERRVMGPADLEAHNANLVGGDITGGSHGGLQLLCRPAPRLVPYATPADDIFLCSASTPPGAGVHGMCGYRAARVVLRRLTQWPGERTAA